jgi:hypothetical protein
MNPHKLNTNLSIKHYLNALKVIVNLTHRSCFKEREHFVPEKNPVIH